MSKQYNIVGVTGNSFTINGDFTALFRDPDGAGSQPAIEFDVQGSTGNNGRYKVQSSMYAAGQTIIVVEGSVSSGVADGYITNTTAYLIAFSDSSIQPFVVFPKFIDNTHAPFTIIGRSNVSYGEPLFEGLLHAVEHFASPTQPSNPITGMGWFDKSLSTLKIYNGTTWKTCSLVSATGPSSYVHRQTVDSSTWNIVHNMGTTDVTISVYTVVGGLTKMILPQDITVVDANNIQVTFSTPKQGKVVITAA